MGKCKTCKTIREIGEIEERTRKESGKRPYVTVLKVKLFKAIYRGTRLDGAMTYRASTLNFCPECGKKVEREKKTWTD